VFKGAWLRRLRSVRARLFLSYLAMLIPVIVIGILWTDRTVSNEQVAYKRNAEAEATRTATRVASFLARSRTMAESLAELPEVKQQRVEQVTAILARQLSLNTNFNNISLLDANGYRRATALDDGTGNLFLGDRLYFEEALATGRSAVGEAVISRGGKVRDHPIVTVSAPVRDDSGRAIGVLIVNSIVGELEKEFSDVSNPGGLYSFVVDQRGKTVIHPNAQYADEMKDMSALKPVQDALQGESGYVEFTDPADNLPYLAAYQPVPESPWGVVAVQPLSEVQGSSRQAVIANGVAILLAVLVGFGIALLIGGRLSRAISQMTEAVEAVGAGDLDRQVGISRSDELGRLAQTFNRMTASLKAITASKEDLAREVAERQRAEAEVRQLNESLSRRASELAAANKELEAFSYSVSHDLRAPLRHIDGFSKILLEDYSERLDDEGRRYLQFVREGSQKMERLVDALLSLSRITRAELHRQPVNLSEIAQSVVAGLRKDRPDRLVEFDIASGVEVQGDPVLLRVVLENLLDNAFKFTANRPDARVEFGASQGQGQPVYFVRDNGAGFDMKYADKLFGPFQRLHRDDEFSGTGIGLATVQRIISRHGGRVWAEGEVGQGAAFYFTLP